MVKPLKNSYLDFFGGSDPRNQPKKGITSGGIPYEVLTFREIKHLIDTDPSLKCGGYNFYTGGKIYYVKDDQVDGVNLAWHYYCNREDKTQKTDNQDFIMDLIYKRDRIILNTKGSKILDIESGIIYDGGEFARKEIVKYDQNEERMMEENTISTVVHGVERLVEERAKNILESQTVKITREALDKAYKIAERMIAVSQAENEIYMNGTNFIDRRSDPVIRDVYILKNQIVTFGKCKPVGSDDEDFKEWKESGKYELAWMHSHAMIPPRHSPEDDRNLAVMTKYSADGIKTKIDLSDISILGYKINEKKSSLMLTLYPSIVVNAKRERSYVGIGASYSLPVKIPSSEKSPLRYFSRRNVPLEILDESNLIDSTTESIERIIWERVKWDGKEKSKGLERRVKPSPSWSELEKVILKYPSAIDATPIEDYDRNGKGVVRNGRSYLNKVNQIATMVFGRRKARNREMIWKKNHPKKVEASEVL